MSESETDAQLPTTRTGRRTFIAGSATVISLGAGGVVATDDVLDFESDFVPETTTIEEYQASWDPLTYEDDPFADLDTRAQS